MKKPLNKKKENLIFCLYFINILNIQPAQSCASPNVCSQNGNSVLCVAPTTGPTVTPTSTPTTTPTTTPGCVNGSYRCGPSATQFQQCSNNVWYVSLFLLFLLSSLPFPLSFPYLFFCTGILKTVHPQPPATALANAIKNWERMCTLV